VSTLLALLAGYMTSGTWWIIPQTLEVGIVDEKGKWWPMAAAVLPGGPMTGTAESRLVPGLQAFRASCLTTGRFRMARGGSPSFDPATALYATSDTVANLAAVYGIAILGDVASSKRLLAHSHTWKQWMSLDQALAHPHLGKTMPRREVIIAAYADDEVIEA
jgi:hypothetical protein